MSSGKRRIPDAVLEFYLASLLDEPARARVETSLAQSEPDRVRLEELRADSEALLLKHPAAPMAARIERLLEQRKRRRRWWALMVPTLAGACVAALLWVQEPPREGLGTGTPSGTGFMVNQEVSEYSDPGDHQESPPRWWSPKGTKSIAFRVLSLEYGIEPKGLFTPSEPLVLEFWSEHAGYVAVLVQERSVGGVRSLYPTTDAYAERSTGRFIARVPFTLDGAGEMFVLFSEHPFSVAPVLRAVAEGRQVEDGVPSSVRMFSWVLRPRAAP